MPETINLGRLQLRSFLKQRRHRRQHRHIQHDRKAERTMPIPHYHESWDETPYGLTGTTTWRVDGKDIDVGPGETVFIKHGIVHGFTNRTTEATMSRSLDLRPLGRFRAESLAVTLTG